MLSVHSQLTFYISLSYCLPQRLPQSFWELEIRQQALGVVRVGGHWKPIVVTICLLCLFIISLETLKLESSYLFSRL